MNHRPQPRSGHRKPRSADKLARKTFLPCVRCGELHAPAELHDNDGRCDACWRHDWQAHQGYLREHAIVIARFNFCVWTPDLFDSELAIESDGCYIQRVTWRDPETRKKHFGEQIDCFEPTIWAAILAEAQALSVVYQPHDAVMDDIETHEISLRLDTQLITLSPEAGCCVCADGAARLQHLWMQIHARSQWRDRLKL
ncbi:hypothetical protein IQ266_18525 [filamentous cyanobacterium LEGE 11480]|uniref:Uncharacterized protein n=1 Tax=Romeriopsis navalis LEGE 11480 TaxID=2777977 RepID=A0A928VSH1_9CYAN|nr:hypothetical protein [Romeriopsis navalis]MBE9031732.1 hypothetical protein [Romeriopsis navalis LEGE 11480]